MCILNVLPVLVSSEGRYFVWRLFLPANTRTDEYTSYRFVPILRAAFHLVDRQHGTSMNILTATCPVY